MRSYLVHWLGILLISITSSALTLNLTLTATPAQAADANDAAMVVDVNSGRVLYALQPDARRHPASLTKVMTLYVLFDYLKQRRLQLDTPFLVTRTAAAQSPSKLGLKPGTSIRVADAIRALVTKSANDVAAVVAENLAGSEAKFARLMTAKARELGMTRTVYRNASGLPDKRQVTTARDMITLSLAIMRDFPEYYGFFKLKRFTWRGHSYRNHNRLLFNYWGTEGIKTGYTRASGFNLTASVRRGNKHLVAVVFGGRTGRARDNLMKRLLTRSFKRAVARKPAPRKPKSKSKTRVAQKPNAPRIEPYKGTDPRIMRDLQRNLTQKTMRDDRKVAERRQQRRNEPTQGSTEQTPPQPLPVVQARGAFHIQIGAYSSQQTAQDQLAKVNQKAGYILRGHRPVALPVRIDQRILYRARFDGFSSRNKAKAVCSRLTRRSSVKCQIRPAD